MKTIVEAVEKKERPIKAIQFGEGNFLRAFIDYQIDVMNEKAGFNGDVIMVQPLERGMGDMINAQNGLYTTVLRGIEDGKEVEEMRAVTSVRGCLNPFTQYEEYISQADNP
ncbi:MAG: tagaturonate reductase, partial [Candidatus Ornithospirochaeta sp.]